MTGIYVLANDRAKEWLIAWFESVRAKGCALPVCILAFDEQMAQVRRIAARYGAEIREDESFAALDRIGLGMTKRVSHGHFYRKLAIFDGPFDTFLYADSDTIALMNWEELVTRFEASNDDLWYCGVSSGEVYKPRPSGNGLQNEKRGRRLNVNTGLLVSRRGVLNLPAIERLAEQTLPVRDQFVDPGDQGFINYWIDQTDPDVKSVADVMPDVHGWNWAESTYYTGQRDMYEIADRTGTFEGRRFAMIHWAGFHVASYMPQRELFLKYRLAHAPFSDRLYYYWAWRVRPRFGNIKRRMQAQHGY